MQKNGKGETVELPILNDTNYTYSQVAADGTEYTYNNGQSGKAYFMHKTYSEIVIEKEITADTITFGYKDYNNVDINWKVAKNFSSKLTGAYVDGTYVLTLVNGYEKSISNMDSLNYKYKYKYKPNVKITGNGKLIVSHTKEGVNDTSATILVQQAK